MNDRYAVAADGRTVPAEHEFPQWAASRRVVPVVRKFLADSMTPVGLYQALTAGRPGTFLLESAENGRSWSRFSFVGVRSGAMLTEQNGQACWLGDVPVAGDAITDPLEALRHVVDALATPPEPGLPPFTSGMVGCIGYDAVRRWERIPDSNPDELGFPELAMLLATDVAVLDHEDATVLLIANAVGAGAAGPTTEDYADAVARLDVMEAGLCAAGAEPPSVFDRVSGTEFRSRSAPGRYQADVETAKEHIYAGDAFQIVLSQRFEADCPADALDVYRVLRATNPSPYMYLIRLPDPAGPLDETGMPTAVGFEVVGSSPEALVTVKERQAVLHPIAGTRPRSADAAQDSRFAEEMLNDVKERAEHLMLVDLGRNDLGRVCRTGTVDVVQFMAVERYSHVMHLVSTVTGELSAGMTAFDALAATFPAGTLSGAPKPRAMEIIDDLEPARRGLYAGAVGYLDFAGNLDTAIAIRTALIRDGRAYVQAGAGLVADSVPDLEEQESRNKAAAVLDAIASAATLRPASPIP
ncbi:MAG: anthranilate synthase component I [Actinobacteria bacterium]|nr:anthranilate synthase component I [Actinomycetota bacterium]